MKEQETEAQIEYDYYQIKIKPNLFGIFVELHLKNTKPLEKPCYIDLKEAPFSVYMPIEVYEDIKSYLDPIFFSSKSFDKVSSEYLRRYFDKSVNKKPIIGTTCTTQIEVGEFMITAIDEKKKSALLKNSKTGELMSVPFKYLNLK